MVSSDYGLACLKAVSKLENIQNVGIITTPRNFILNYGKGQRKEMINAVYELLWQFSEEKNVPLFIINKMNDADTINFTKSCNPDLIIVSGWYHLIGKEIRGIPPKGVIALHASLLPKYKGGAPLVWQMINGEEFAGITLFYMDEGVDSGDIIAQRRVKIEYEDTIDTLYKKVGDLGISLMIDSIPDIAGNAVPRIKQNSKDESIYPQRTKDDGCIKWDDGAKNIYNFVRAQTRPYPGAFSMYNGHRLTIWKVSVVEAGENQGRPGEIVCIYENGEFDVATCEKGYNIHINEFNTDENAPYIKIMKGMMLKSTVL